MEAKIEKKDSEREIEGEEEAKRQNEEKEGTPVLRLKKTSKV